MTWLQNPLSDYVIAAYGVAGVVLVGLLLATWCAARCRNRQWQKLQVTRKDRA